MSARDLFAAPEAWPLLLLVPLVWGVLKLLDSLRLWHLVRLIGSRVHFVAADFAPGQRRLRRWLITLGLLLAVLAMLQPLWGEIPEDVSQRGIDLLVCLDVSRSMLARDLEPSRLQSAKREIRALAERVRGDRLGLVVFAGEARLAVPLTQDLESFVSLVERADPLSVRRGGTDLGAALETALDALQDRSGRHEAVLLLTDGEDHGGRGLRVAELCKERNITVHCAGFGSALGSKIALAEDGAETFLLDRSGAEVISALDVASLRRLAEATGGEFVAAASTARPLVDLYQRRIRYQARRSFDAAVRRERAQRFQWPLALAVALWTLELCLTDRRRP